MFNDYVKPSEIPGNDYIVPEGSMIDFAGWGVDVS